MLHWEGVKSSLELLEIDTDQPELVKYYLENYICDPLYLMTTACDNSSLSPSSQQTIKGGRVRRHSDTVSVLYD
jgi:hypothetical protein